jgi:hypothetical protein
VAGQDFSGRAFQQTDLKREFATDSEYVHAASFCPHDDESSIAALGHHDAQAYLRQIGEHCAYFAASVMRTSGFINC